MALLLFWGLFYACSTKKKLPNKVYSIARSSNWYPLRLINKEKSMQGFIDDLLTEISREENFKFYWFQTSTEPLLSGLSDRSYDAILSFIQPSNMTRDRYSFSEIIFRTGPVLVVPINSNVRSLDDLSGKIVGIQTGMTLIYNEIMQKPKESNYLLTSYENMTRALDTLASNQIDAVIMEVIPAYTYIQTFYRDKLKIITLPLTDEGFRLIALKNDNLEESLIKRFDEGLNKLKETKKFEALLYKWGLLDTENLLNGNQERR